MTKSHDGVWASSNDPDEMLDLIDSVPGLSINVQALVFVLIYAVRRVEHLTDTPAIGWGIIPEKNKAFLDVNGEAYHVIQGVRNLLRWAREVETDAVKRHCQLLFTAGSPEHAAAYHALLSWVEVNARATVAHMLRHELGNPFVPTAKASGAGGSN